jgi:hypothetical protein
MCKENVHLINWKVKEDLNPRIVIYKKLKKKKIEESRNFIKERRRRNEKRIFLLVAKIKKIKNS